MKILLCANGYNLYCNWLFIPGLGVGIENRVIKFVMFAITVVLIVQVFAVKNCVDCDEYPWKQTYSYTVVALLDAVFMILLNVWLLWGIKKEKSSVVLSWVAGIVIWLTQSGMLLLVLLCLYGSQVNVVEWVASVVFAVIGLGIIVYGILVVFAYWLELKKSKEAAVTSQ